VVGILIGSVEITTADKLVEDEKIRKYLSARINKGGVSKVVIERTLKRITVTIHTARPGIVIGKGGAGS
jgi:small subunit ribosomal protein S3